MSASHDYFTGYSEEDRKMDDKCSYPPLPFTGMDEENECSVEPQFFWEQQQTEISTNGGDHPRNVEELSLSAPAISSPCWMEPQPVKKNKRFKKEARKAMEKTPPEKLEQFAKSDDDVGMLARSVLKRKLKCREYSQQNRTNAKSYYDSLESYVDIMENGWNELLRIIQILVSFMQENCISIPDFNLPVRPVRPKKTVGRSFFSGHQSQSKKTSDC